MNTGSDKQRPPAVEQGAKVMVWIAGAVLIAMSFVITAETLFRKFGGFSLGGVHEYSAYLFAITSAWAFGWALLQGSHIRISLLREKCGPRMRSILDILALVAFLLVFAAIAYRAVELAWDSYATNARSPTASRTPLYIPQAFWALGFVGTVLTAIHIAYRVIRDRSTDILKPADEVEAELEHLR